VSGNRLIVVSNRLPVVLSRSAEGELESRPGDGGLVSALVPVLQDRRGLWIGWSGLKEAAPAGLGRHLRALAASVGYSLEAVSLSPADVEGFYEGFSNDVLWPLFHDFISAAGYEHDRWHRWNEVNRKFAEASADACTGSDLLWIHDYHLMSTGAHLRRLGVRNQIGFFLHIPFPTPDVFMRIPWRLEILRDLLKYDLIGFQTLRDRRHFVQCLRMLFHIKVSGRGQVQQLRVTEKSGGITRRLRIGSFPIGIDYEAFAARSASSDIEGLMQELTHFANGRRMILSVDRLDYTKGLVTKLRAFRAAISRSPQLLERVTLCLQVVPSREDIPRYRQLRLETERLISEINGRFSRPGKIPVHYFYGRLTRDELIARYRAADVMLVTPYKDGMNLIAKEYCACQSELDGVLVLSEFAGAAAELQRSALLVNPHDIEGIASAMQRAIDMPAAERAQRMTRARGKIRGNDVFHWVDTYLRALSGKDLASFATIEDYVPEATPRLRTVPLQTGSDVRPQIR
jgi:trehalose 6-phosphate synthase/phosphatase